MNSAYLGDGKVQAYVDYYCEEEDIEGPDNQQRLLQHQDLIEGIMNLVHTKKETDVYYLAFAYQIHILFKVVKLACQSFPVTGLKKKLSCLSKNIYLIARELGFYSDWEINRPKKTVL